VPGKFILAIIRSACKARLLPVDRGTVSYSAQTENGLAHKFKTVLKKPERGKHSSLSCFCISDEYKKLYPIDAGSLGSCEN
jgi:hypothetical protein